MTVDLSLYHNNLHQPAGTFKRIFWYYINIVIYKSGLIPFYGIKTAILKLFGATIGNNVIIKPSVNIKYPWNLHIGNNVWIGENVWIDNLVAVKIGNNVCLSQGVTLINGNHNYKKKYFDLMIAPIVIEDGAWVCTKSIIHGGTTLEENVVLLSGSVTSEKLTKDGVYRGNPAVRIRERQFSE